MIEIDDVQLQPRKQEELLTISEVAQALRVDDTTVRRWIKNNAMEAVILPHVNTRQGYRVKRSVLNTIMQNTYQPA